MSDASRGMLAYEGEAGPVQAYLARPGGEEPRPAVIVIHDIMGLSEHTKQVADRFVEAGYVALAPHLFSRPGLAEVLTPSNVGAMLQFANTVGWARLSDPDAVQQALSQLPQEQRETVQRALPVVFGGIPKDRLTEDLVKAVDYLQEQRFVRAGKVVSVGFCFGGGMSINLACHAHLAACVIFYGENPQPIELVERLSCPVLGNYGAEDLRINAHLDDLVRAMVTYKKDFEMRIYPNAAHAFFSETSPLYNETAAKDAWERVLRFYTRALAD